MSGPSYLQQWLDVIGDANNGLTLPEKGIAFIISRFMNGEGAGAFPSQETLAVRAGCSRDSVVRHSKSLEKKGYLRRTNPPEHKRKGQSWRVLRYQATYPQGSSKLQQLMAKGGCKFRHKVVANSDTISSIDLFQGSLKESKPKKALPKATEQKITNNEKEQETASPHAAPKPDAAKSVRQEGNGEDLDPPHYRQPPQTSTPTDNETLDEETAYYFEGCVKRYAAAGEMKKLDGLRKRFGDETVAWGWHCGGRYETHEKLVRVLEDQLKDGKVATLPYTPPPKRKRKPKPDPTPVKPKAVQLSAQIQRDIPVGALGELSKQYGAAALNAAHQPGWDADALRTALEDKATEEV